MQVEQDLKHKLPDTSPVYAKVSHQKISSPRELEPRYKYSIRTHFATTTQTNHAKVSHKKKQKKLPNGSLTSYENQYTHKFRTKNIYYIVRLVKTRPLIIVLRVKNNSFNSAHSNKHFELSKVSFVLYICLLLTLKVFIPFYTYKIRMQFLDGSRISDNFVIYNTLQVSAFRFERVFRFAATFFGVAYMYDA